jgi:hypothetical protein
MVGFTAALLDGPESPLLYCEAGKLPFVNQTSTVDGRTFPLRNVDAR